MPLAADVRIVDSQRALEFAVQFHRFEGGILAQAADDVLFGHAGRQLDHIDVRLTQFAALAAVRLEDLFEIVRRNPGKGFDKNTAARVLVATITEIIAGRGRHAVQGQQRQRRQTM